MHVIVYSFEKKAKSTLIPKNLSPDKYTDMECVLKDDGCGICAPVLEINYGLVKAPVNYNYAWIEDFKRYYFCKDWVFAEGLWYGVLEEDYLATWAEDIKNSNAYILRAASAWNRYVADNMYPVLAETVVLSNEIDYPFRIGNPEHPKSGGDFVIGINGFMFEGSDSSPMWGSTVYYVMNWYNMQEFMRRLLNTTDWLEIDWTKAEVFITEDLLKTLFNPIQYIASCVWVPTGVSGDRTTDVSSIKFGWWEMDLGARILATQIPETYIESIPIPKHPQSAERGEYLNTAPYSTYQLHVPPYGLIDIPADELLGETELTIEWNMDYMTGQGRIMVATSKRFINLFNVMMGVPIPVAQINSNPWEALEGVSGFVTKQVNRIDSAINGAVGSVLGGLKGGGGSIGSGDVTTPTSGLSAFSFISTPVNLINETIGAIGDIAQSITPTVQTLQGAPNGTLIGFAIESFVRLSGKFAKIGQEDNERLGRPLCVKMRIGDLKGFVKTLGANVIFEGNAVEHASVNALLDSGVFIE